MEDERRYISFDELLAYRQELDAQELQEESERRRAEAAKVIHIEIDGMEAAQDITQLVLIFRALANSTRLEIVEFLIARPATAGQIASELDLHQNTLSRHLKVLEEAGLVSVERSGVMKLYQASDLAGRVISAAGDEGGQGAKAAR